MMGRWWLLLMVLLCLWGSNLCFELFSESNEPKDIDELQANIDDLINSVSGPFFPLFVRITRESNISVPCSQSLLHFYEDLKKLKEWALKMFDASAKAPAGILRGKMAAYGDYDECLDVVVTGARRKILFEGKYCMVELRGPEFVVSKIIAMHSSKAVRDFLWTYRDLMAIRLGVCVPSTCTAGEINRIAQFVSRAFGLQSNVTCETKVKKEPDTLQLVCLCIFSVFAFLVIIGTGIDVVTQYTRIKMSSGELNKLLIAFSLYSNTILLFDTAEKDKTLSALHGCRVLPAFCIILGHTYIFPNAAFLLKHGGILTFAEFAEQLLFKTITSGVLLIDTFFLLSGMLFLYIVWRQLERSKGWINPFTYILHRVARILPNEVLVITVFMVLPLFGSGPIWEETFKENYAACRDNWWMNLLFIQNFWPFERICLLHTWFLALLLQLSILTFGTSLVIYRWPKVGICINLLLIVTGCIVIGLVTSSYDLPSQFSLQEGSTSIWPKYYDVVYGRPYTYFGAYCTGVLLGYTIITKRHRNIKPWAQVICWLLSACGAATVWYGMYFFDRKSYKELHILFAVFHRMIWCSAVAWVVFACVTGYGGIIGRVLSSKVMVLLDKLALLIYLLHPLVLYYHKATTRSVIPTNHIEKFYIFLATVTVTVGLSCMLNVTFEQPMRYIELRVIRMFSKSPLQIVQGTTSLPPNREQTSPLNTTITLTEPSAETSSSKF